MSEHDKEQKTEEATEKQISQFRERGDVAKSRDVASLVTLAAGTGAMILAWPIISSSIFDFSTGVFGRLDVGGREAFLFRSAGSTLVGMVAPVAISIMVFGIVGQLLQVGWHPSSKSIAFKPGKLNPLPRAKQLLFSGATAIELLKSLVKMGVIGAIAIYVLKKEVMDNGRLIGLVPIEFARRLGSMALKIMLHVGIAFAIIAVLDLILERYRHKKKMKMTKEQVKQESKDREGDPIAKGRQRRRQRDMARSRQLQSVSDADVVVVNPTHYSVAIRYKMDIDAAPIILAMGKDILAAKIRERARKSSVPIVSDPKLARALHKDGKVGAYIPADFYKAVASLLAWVYSATGKVAS